MKVLLESRLRRVHAFAFTLTELLVVVVIISVLGLMLMPALTNCRRSATRIQCVSKLKQLGLAYKVYGSDNDDRYPYAVSNNIAFGDQKRAWIHYQAMAYELSVPSVMACPVDVKKRQRKTAANFGVGKAVDANSLSVLKNQAVSYFVGVNATPKTPFAVLSGDRGISDSGTNAALSSKFGSVTLPATAQWTVARGDNLHDNQGNLLIADGSVNQASVSILQNQMKLAQEKHGTNVNRFVFPQ